MILEAFKAFLVTPLGDADTLSYVRGGVALICLAAFAMTWQVSISSFPTAAMRLTKHAARWGVFLVALYYWVAASNGIPTPSSARVTPLLISIYVGTVLIALSIAFAARDSLHRRDRVEQKNAERQVSNG